ncbi:hypothetical protein LPJ61_004000 [Coemansia biformis]|uniref:Calcineurin-like phosphoesterase domain-containing protein n=1 Tax=Coemansia biformis TaxID=1286918 RepID=A0A9W7Y5M6_9FUNG|nr:hypothetical protein LPJ61_004000 [Coemansia biformis]
MAGMARDSFARPAVRRERKKHFSVARRAAGGDSSLKTFKAKDAQLIETRKFEGTPPKRLIFIGDIHGCLPEFNELIDTVKYKPGEDQIVLVGDLVAKGPDSLGVVRKARQLQAWCVRGNHDDRVIRWYQFLQGPAKGMSDSDLKSLGDSSGLPYDDFKVGKEHYTIAQSIPSCDAAFLAAFPAMMTLPAPFSEWLVLHGGLDPSKPLDQQKAEDVWTTRNIGPSGPISTHDEGSAWFDAWAKAMADLKPTTPADYSKIQFYKAIYGHDAGRDLQIHDITKGLDSRCVYGGKLTAFILPGEQLVSVPCKEHVSSKDD